MVFILNSHIMLQNLPKERKKQKKKGLDHKKQYNQPFMEKFLSDKSSNF